MTDSKYWKFSPGEISCTRKELVALVNVFTNMCEANAYNMYGKTIYSKRKCCILVDDIDIAREYAKSDDYSFDYVDTPAFLWSQAPKKIVRLRKKLEKQYKLKFDYVLVNLYDERGATIGWHNDSEAMDSDIISVSLGATRRFYFRRISDGEESLFHLQNGDVLHMKGPHGKRKSCQRIFEHHVPAMNIKDLVRHIETCNVEIPKGRKTYKMLDQLMIDNDIEPLRINLTFRKYE